MYMCFYVRSGRSSGVAGFQDSLRKISSLDVCGCADQAKTKTMPKFNDFHPRSIHSWFAQTKLVLSSDFPHVIQKIKRGVISRILLLPIQPWFAQTSLVFSCAFPLPIQQLPNSIQIWLVRTTLKLSLCLLHPSFICCTQASWCTQASKCASKLRKLGYLAPKLRLLVQAHMAPLSQFLQDSWSNCLRVACRKTL